MADDEQRPTWKRSKYQIGREFNKELAEEIIRRMEAGDDLAFICKEEHMPKIRAVANWRKDNPEFNQAYLRAYHKNLKIVDRSRTGIMGRPTIRTEAMVEELLARLESGEILAQICRLDHMPAAGTISDWLARDEILASRLARARMIGAQAIVADCIDIADDGRNDFYEKVSKNGETFVALNAENIQRSRLRIDTRKWMVASIDPSMRESPQVKLNINSAGLSSVAIGNQLQPSEASETQTAYEEYQKLIKGE